MFQITNSIDSSNLSWNSESKVMGRLFYSILLVGLFWMSPWKLYVFPTSYDSENFSVRKLKNFEMEARILSKKLYRFGSEAKISPVDFAFGWGRMADLKISDQVEVSQGNRWYKWRVSEYPIPKREIEISSANMHMIPATPEIAKALVWAKSGELIRLNGKLVEVHGPGDFNWKSSLSREDTGAGACEVVLVESFEHLGRL